MESFISQIKSQEMVIKSEKSDDINVVDFNCTEAKNNSFAENSKAHNFQKESQKSKDLFHVSSSTSQFIKTEEDNMTEPSDTETAETNPSSFVEAIFIKTEREEDINKADEDLDTSDKNYSRTDSIPSCSTTTSVKTETTTEGKPDYDPSISIKMPEDYHSLLFPEKDLIECDICTAKYHRKAWRKHRGQHTGEENNKCNMCHRSFFRYSTLLLHKRTHINGRALECEFCHKKFDRYGNLAMHLRSHTGEKPFKCEFCEKRFTANHSLVVHRRQHTGEAPFKCEVCSLSFTSAYARNYHKNIHLEEKPFTCEICLKKFTHQTTLHKHRRVHQSERPHVCEICSKSFTESHNLVKHKRIHSGEKPYTCKLCDKRFTGSNNLQKHLLTHSGEKPYECEFCFKKFSSSSNLTKHKRTHTGEKPFSCEFCDRRFTQHCTLLKHRRLHTGETFDCNNCSKKFYYIGDLKRHKKIHTDDTVLGCGICGKFCNNQNELIEHSKIHSKAIFECETCYTTFSDVESFEKHKDIHKNIIDEIDLKSVVNKTNINSSPLVINDSVI